MSTNGPYVGEKNGLPSNEQFDVNDTNGQRWYKHLDGRNESRARRTRRAVHGSSDDKQITTNDASTHLQEMVDHMSHMSQSMMDAVDVRIEGMEDMMNELQETVKKLNKKVSI